MDTESETAHGDDADLNRSGSQGSPRLPLLRASPYLLNALFAVAPFAAAILDANLTCQAVNSVFAQIAVKDTAWCVGRPAQDILPFPPNAILPDLRRVLSTGTPIVGKEMVSAGAESSPGAMPPSGNRRAWSVDIQPVIDVSGDVEALCVFLSETAERRKTESLARDAMQRLAFHVENTPLAVVEYDRDFHISLWSARAEAMFGWTAEEVMGLHPSDWSFVLEDDLPTVERTMNDLLDGVSRNVSLNRNRTKDGKVLFCEWYNSALRDRDGSVLSVLSLVQDVTAQRDASRRQRKFFREMLESLTEGRLCLCDTTDDLPDALPQTGEPVTLTPRTLRRIRRDVDVVAEAASFSHARRGELITAVSEAAMNAIVHAGGGEAKVCADVKTGRMQVWIQDAGAGIREDALHRATPERGFSSTGSLGHGFWMMLKTVDCVFLLTGPQGTTIVLEQNRVSSEPSWLRTARFIMMPGQAGQQV